jgi:hypothetical protein
MKDDGRSFPGEDERISLGRRFGLGRWLVNLDGLPEFIFGGVHWFVGNQNYLGVVLVDSEWIGQLIVYHFVIDVQSEAFNENLLS